ncbi:uncharacterized protein isoform X1 [Leptinotarsa decemlineata]|uniref:uncharacterized protein isoform X1 n=1 Tax=Leptinotarsa decemlineata TaxID=7539 RepID=UPI003D30A08F
MSSADSTTEPMSVPECSMTSTGPIQVHRIDSTFDHFSTNFAQMLQRIYDLPDDFPARMEEGMQEEVEAELEMDVNELDDLEDNELDNYANDDAISISSDSDDYEDDIISISSDTDDDTIIIVSDDDEER